MKVSVIGWELPPAFSGGLGVHTLNLLNRLSKFIDITLYVPSMKGLSQTYEFEVIPVPTGISGLPYSVEGFPDFQEAVHDYNEAVLRIFNPAGVQAVHVHDWITMEAGIRIKEKFGIPLVVTVHSTEIDRSGNFNPQRRIMDIEKRGIEQADTVIVVSGYTKNILVSNYGSDPSKIRVIHNGVARFTYSWNKKDYALTNRVLYFGRVTSQKGPKFFIESAAKVSEKIPDVSFIIAGNGDQLPEVLNLSNELGISDRTVFTGFVNFSKSVLFYRSSDVFVLPAVSEPFGMTVIESMISGTPAIISKTTGVGEALRNVMKSDFWDTDLIAEYIISILKYKSLRKTLGELGQVEAAGFTWEKSAEETMEVYRSL